MGSCLSASAPTSPEDKYARDKNGKLKRKDSNTDIEKAAKIAKDKKAAEQKAALKASDKVSDKCPQPRLPTLPTSFSGCGGQSKSLHDGCILHVEKFGTHNVMMNQE